MGWGEDIKHVDNYFKGIFVKKKKGESRETEVGCS